MCRFVAYLGAEPVLLKKILRQPKNSLIDQSFSAKQSIHVINADGFGLAWYNQELDQIPGIFKSIQPAWNDKNLYYLSEKIQSKCFISHVRASTVGEVTLNNCHPFFYKQYSFVHNGTIRNFQKIRKKLINQLSEEILANIKAQTDSEHLFALIMQFLKYECKNNLEQAVIKSFEWIIQAQKQDLDLAIDHKNNFSELNILITDGQKMIATKFASKNNPTLSLYYALGTDMNLDGDELDILDIKTVEHQKHKLIVIASEPLSEHKDAWHTMPDNSYLTVNNRFEFNLKQFNLF